MTRLRGRSIATALFASMLSGLLLLFTAPAACAAPACAFVSGSGTQEVENSFTWSTCAEGTPLRVGNTQYGLVHIESGGSTGNTDNHEVTAFAMTQWQAALDKPAINSTVDDFYKHSTFYTTPGGEGRTMCVIVDGNDRDGTGQRGIITAYYTVGVDDCLAEV